MARIFFVILLPNKNYTNRNWTGKGCALSEESCAKTFGWRTGLDSFSSSFRQFVLWLAVKSRLGAIEKPGAVRSEQAPSAVSRLFGIAAQSSACCADRPQPRMQRKPNFVAPTAPERTAACRRPCCFSSIAAKGNPLVELARSSGFSFAAYFRSTV